MSESRTILNRRRARRAHAAKVLRDAREECRRSLGHNMALRFALLAWLRRDLGRMPNVRPDLLRREARDLRAAGREPWPVGSEWWPCGRQDAWGDARDECARMAPIVARMARLAEKEAAR